MEHEIFVCKCGNPEHQVILTYYPDDVDNRDIYMTIYLRPRYSFFKRTWVAIKYIFGYRSKYGDFDDIIIKQSDSHKLVRILKYMDPDVFIRETKNSSNS